MKNFIVFLGGILLFASCASVKVVGDEKGQVVAMEKSPCFGKCPYYSMQIFKDGKVVYNGKANTKKLGIFEKTIDKKELNTVVKAFNSSKFSTFNDTYSSELADLPSTMLYYADGKTKKTITGKENRPAEVLKLQYMLEKIADSDGWLMKEGLPKEEKLEERAVEEEVIIYSEIIIEPQPGSLGRFLQDYQDKSISLSDRLTEDGRLWLIRYNTNTHKPEAMLQMIKSDSRIISAEFNKKLQTRQED